MDEPTEYLLQFRFLRGREEPLIVKVPDPQLTISEILAQFHINLLYYLTGADDPPKRPIGLALKFWNGAQPIQPFLRFNQLQQQSDLFEDGTALMAKVTVDVNDDGMRGLREEMFSTMGRLRSIND